MIEQSHLLRRFDKLKKTSWGWIAACPGHDDKTPSLSISRAEDGRWLLKCHANCDFNHIVQAANLTPADLSPASNGAAAPAASREIVYRYEDENGKLAFEVVRRDTREGKKILQRRPDPEKPGAYIWNLKYVRRVLYRLPQLLAAAPDQIVYIVEGEKCADALASCGLTATTNSGGAEKWLATYNEHVAERRIVILPDNDLPGFRHARQVAAGVGPLASAWAYLQLPGLSEGDDVADWLQSHNAAELQRLAEQSLADKIHELRTENDPAGGLPEIDLEIVELKALSDLAWAALLKRNEPPYMFRRAGQLVRLDTDEKGRITTVPMTTATMAHEVRRAAIWTFKGNPSNPPRDLASDMLEQRGLPLPPLNYLVTVPVFSTSGKLNTEPGYDPASAVLYVPEKGFRARPLPSRVTDSDVSDAVRFITDEIFYDFPFVAEGDRVNAFALYLLPYLRNLIDGPTPNHLIEASSEGSGKGLLADACALPVLGSELPVGTPCENDEEWEKEILRILLASKQLVLIDNITGTVDSKKLAAALTGREFEGRMMRSHGTIVVPVRCIWIMTGNNPQLSRELTRRSVRIRIAPRVENPWERTGFKKPDLRGWIREHRADCVYAAHVLCQNWIQAGCPPGERIVGSYEEWSKVIGGVLQSAGIAGFLSNSSDFYVASDTNGQAWRDLIEAWEMDFGCREIEIADVLRIVREIENFRLNGKDDAAQKVSLGKLLESKRGCIIGGCSIEKINLGARQKRWKLTRISDDETLI